MCEKYKFSIGVDTTKRSIVVSQYSDDKPIPRKYKRLRVVSVELATKIEQHFGIDLGKYRVKVKEETPFIYITKDKINV